MTEEIEAGIAGSDIKKGFYILGSVKIGMLLPQLYKGIFYDIFPILLAVHQLGREITKGSVMQVKKRGKCLWITLPEFNNDIRI